jgi:SPP1 family phage portal protein
VYISELDLIEQRLAIEGKLNQSEIIRLVLQDASLDIKRRFMAIGDRYYLGRHDIMYHNFQSAQVYDTVPDPNSPGGTKDNTTTIINRNNSNMHNVHLFHQLLVNQKAAYVVGRPPTISVDNDDAFETAITGITTDEDFSDVLYDWVVGASNKGIEWLHIYYDPDGSVKYCIVPADEVVAFYDSEHQTQLQELVRFYMFDVVKSDKTVKRHKVEWWTSEDVTYYIEDDQGYYSLDPSFPCNPMPHWFDVTTVDGMERSRQQMNWGRVPFIPLRNNSQETSDLGGQDDDGRPQGIKSLIDAYDMISSTSTNDQIDLVGLFWVIQGFGGELASQIIKKLQVNKAVCIDGADGGVTAQQVELSLEERLKWLDMLRHDIYHFGMGIDTSDEQLGSNPSGVALKFKYTQLDLKANPMILKLKKALKELFWFITEDMNRQQGTKYDSTKITVTINKTMITNDTETVSMINASRGLVPDKILLAAHPLVDDVNQAMQDMEEQQKKQDQRRAQMFGDGDIHPGADNGGGN